jgi:hypothetical protein
MRTLPLLFTAVLWFATTAVAVPPPPAPAPGPSQPPAVATQPEPAQCDSSQLVLLPNPNGCAVPGETVATFRLGETLRIALHGACTTRLIKELAEKDLAHAVRLSLDDVVMVGLPVAVSQGSTPGELILAFHLQRLPQEQANRQSWDALLGKQHRGYVMTLPVGLEMGNEPARAVRSAPPFQFYVATGTEVGWTLTICLLVFAASYFLLVRNPSALRDTRNGLYSLGKSQMAFWGLLVMLTFAGLWSLTGTMERIPEQVLMLVGISGATGLSAIVINNSKQPAHGSEGQQPPVSKGFWQDICDDGNGLCFHRLQVVIWTVLLGMVFVRSVADVMSMPEFSETLLIMLGISNGVYLGFKFPEKP